MSLEVKYFSAKWCGPCRMMKPIISKEQKERKDVSIKIIDIDDNPEEAIRYGIRSIPTIFMTENGKPIGRYNGFASPIAFKEWIDGFVKVEDNESR